MADKKPFIVGIGELLWDVFPTGKRAGGAPINFVYHATQLGADGCAVSAVGDDDWGREILQELARSNIQGIISTVPYPTGRVQVELKDGIPSYTIVEDVAWDHLPLTPEALNAVSRADAVCYGTLSLRHPHTRETVKKLLAAAPQGALRFFDVNLRQSYYSKELIEELLGFANVFKLNDDELVILRDLFGLTGSDEEVCRALLQKYHLRYLIFTAGDKYSVIYTPDEISRIDTPRVTVEDTVGAGDSFSGAFVCAVLMGKTLKEAHEAAVKTAAFVCTRAGAWPSYL